MIVVAVTWQCGNVNGDSCNNGNDARLQEWEQVC